MGALYFQRIHLYFYAAYILLEEPLSSLEHTSTILFGHSYHHLSEFPLDLFTISF
jgi:hypothetical protein